MTWALVSHTPAWRTTSGPSVTSPAINTTGATLIVVTAQGSKVPTGITDSVGNTYTQIGAGLNGLVMFYCANPTINAAHTFTTTLASNGEVSMEVLAFSGSSGAITPDVSSYALGAQAGSITPSAGGELVLAAAGTLSTSGTWAVTGGFTIGDSVLTAATTGSATAYLAQTAAAAANPTWSGATPASAGIVSFPAAPIPTVTAAPVITGTLVVGNTLSTTNGSWANTPTSFTYQWMRNGVAISGATSSTYVVVSADVGSTTPITCVVTATNANGSGSATSNSLTASPPAISVAPVASGAIAVSATLATTNGTWTNSPTGFTYQWNRNGTPISGATSATYTCVSADLAQSLTCTVTASNVYGSGTSTSNAITAALILPTDANIIYSPYNWDVQTARAKTINAGAYLRCVVDGSVTSIAATFDMTNVTAPPQLRYRVDDGPWTLATSAASIALTIPADNTWPSHAVEIVVKAAYTNAVSDRWTTDNSAVKFTGLVTSSGGATRAIQHKGLNVLVCGDSITEGLYTLENTAVSLNEHDAMQGYAYSLRETLGAEVGVVGLGGQGFTIAGSGSVPVFGTAILSIFSGVARSFTSPIPDLIAINQGTNDGIQGASTAAVQAAAITALNELLAATPSTTVILILRPLDGWVAAQLQAAAAACSAPGRVFYQDTTGWFNDADSAGGAGVHPSGFTSTQNLGPRTAAAARAALAAQGPLMVNIAGTFKSVSLARL